MGIILFLSWFPLLLSISLGFNLSSQVIYQKQKALHICQRYNLANQKYLQKKMKELLKINSRAESLRKQLNIAKNALKVAIASLIPTAIVGAKTFLAFTKAEQLFVFYKQKKILNDSFSFSQKIKKQLKQKLEKVFGKKNIKQYSYKQIGLAVYPKPTASLSPTYYTLPAFSYPQASYTFFKLDIKNLLPLILKHIFPNKERFNIKCSASLIKKNKMMLSLWQY